MELQVSEIQALEPVKFNYEELKAAITEKANTYKNLVYTEENIATAKSDRVMLNKVSKAINEEKKRIKNALLEPYTDFEAKCKELMEIIDSASTSIDAQIKDFESIEKNTKLQDILMYWIEKSGEYAELVNVDKLVQEQWLNKTYSMSKIQDEIDHIIVRIRTDFSVLENVSEDAELVKRLKGFYLNNIDNTSVLSMTMAEKTRIEELNQKLDNVEKVTKNETNITKGPQNLTENKENVTNSEVIERAFKIIGTKEQILSVRDFMVQNNIKFGSVK